MIRRWYVHLVVLSAIIALPLACSSPAPAVLAPGSEPPVVQNERMAMGSILRLTAVTSDEAGAQAAFAEIFAEFDRLEQLMSVWKPGSDILRLNAAAGAHPEKVAPDVVEVIEIANEVSGWTEGKFDITFGALADIWKFDHDQDDSIPGADAIAARIPLIDYRQHGDNEIGVFKHGGQYYAYSNFCLHQGGPACEGLTIAKVEERLRPDKTSQGLYFSEKDMNFVCPWHGMEYDMKTGECISNRKMKLKKYQVLEKGDEVYVVA